MRVENYSSEFDVPYDNSKKILIQIFTTKSDIEYIVKPMLLELQDRMPNAAIIGMSTSTVISNGELKKNTSTIIIAYMKFSYAETAILESSDKISKSMKTAIKALKRKRKNEKIAIVFGTKFANGDTIVHNFKNDGTEIPIIGGLAEEGLSDESGTKRNFVFTNDGIVENGVAICFLYGTKLNIHTGVDTSWTPIGNKFKVTRSDGNRVYELNNKPIAEIYKHYLGDEALKEIKKDSAFSLNYPLLLSEQSSHMNISVARAIIATTDEYFLFAGNVKEGEHVSFGFSDISVDGSSCDTYFNTKTAQEKTAQEKTEAFFTYSCIARKIILNNAAQEESLMLNRIAPTNGCFTYGEFFFRSREDGAFKNKFLNQSLVILGLYENGSSEKKKSLCKPVSSKGGIKRRAMHHFINTISKELNDAISKTEIAFKMEKEAKHISNFQLEINLVKDMLAMLKDRIVSNIQDINASVTDVSFKNDVNKLEPNDILLMKSQIDIASEKINSTLIAYDKVIQGSTSNEPGAFLLSDVFETLFTVLSPSLIKKNIILDFHLNREQDEITIKNNSLAFKKILLPIIMNSVESIEKRIGFSDGRIDISVETESKEWVVFKVKDNGIGIKEENLPNIFKCGYSTKEKGSGNGLGLYLTKQLLDEYIGGKIFIYNNLDDHGATVEFSIPHIK